MKGPFRLYGSFQAEIAAESAAAILPPSERRDGYPLSHADEDTAQTHPFIGNFTENYNLRCEASRRQEKRSGKVGSALQGVYRMTPAASTSARIDMKPSAAMKMRSAIFS